MRYLTLVWLAALILSVKAHGTADYALMKIWWGAIRSLNLMKITP